MQTGKADMAMGAIGINEERQKQEENWPAMQMTVVKIVCLEEHRGLVLVSDVGWQQAFGKYFVLWIHCDISFLIRTKNITLLVYAHTWLYR